ncbi:hypothetical protein [Myxococcus qinghaiensis]|uniref:hypothetical protein n=1 Tax=Myxococcus qinghaiensis TaxID=2906758 RepID=UPI0020A8168C|nr:hypothetical protein [Myxococcus qinghaiensis]MCP3164361.1 hypothetical protein [Myxococcus qinghaiensis]
MARAVGRDVMVRLIGEVAELREEMKTTRTHTRIMSSGMGHALTSLGSMRENMGAMQVNMGAMRENMGTMQANMDAMRQNMDVMWQSMDVTRQNMDVMWRNMDSFRSNADVMMTHVESVVGELRALSGGLQRMDTHAGRLARLLGSLADSTNARFEQVEKRLTALEDDEKH